MVVTVKVTRSAVIMLNGDLAKVMVFADQTATRVDTKQTTTGSAQLHLNAQLTAGKWKITDMDTYTSAAATQAPAPSSPATTPSK
jgi:Mce-associated membrane protein